MLPEVGSTIVPPGLSLPVALGRLDQRAAPMRSFTEPPGLRYSSLASSVRAAVAPELRQAHDRRVADEVEDGRVLARHRREAYWLYLALMVASLEG